MLIYPTCTVSNVGMPLHKCVNLTCPNLALHSASRPGPLPSDFHLGESALYPAMLEHLSLYFSVSHPCTSQPIRTSHWPFLLQHTPCVMFSSSPPVSLQPRWQSPLTHYCRNCFSCPSLPILHAQLKCCLLNAPGSVMFLLNPFSELPYLHHYKVQTHPGLQRSVRASPTCLSDLTTDHSAWAMQTCLWFSLRHCLPSLSELLSSLPVTITAQKDQISAFPVSNADVHFLYIALSNHIASWHFAAYCFVLLARI